MIQATIVKVAGTLITSIFTEKVILNLLVLLANWAVNRWGNDLAEDIFEQFKDALDKDQGQPMNLYDDIKKKVGGRK